MDNIKSNEDIKYKQFAETSLVLQSWGFVKNHAHDEEQETHSKEEDWILRHLVIENGIVYAYADDSMCNSIQHFEIYSSHVLKLEEFIQIASHDFECWNIELADSTVFSLAIQVLEAPLWSLAFEVHKSVRRVLPVNYIPNDNDDIDTPAPAHMQIHLKNTPYNIPVSPDNDISLLAENFVKEHRLKQEIKPKIEAELLKTQVDSCILYQARLKKVISSLKRKAVFATFLEAKLDESESTCSKLQDSLCTIEKSLSLFKSTVTELKVENLTLKSSMATHTAEGIGLKTAVSSLQNENKNLKLQLQRSLKKASQKQLCDGKESKVEKIALVDACIETEVDDKKVKGGNRTAVDNDEIINKYERRIEECELEIENLQAEARDFASKLKQKEKELVQAKQALENVKLHDKEEKKNHAEKEENKTALTKKLADMEASKLNLQQKYNHLKMTADTAHATIKLQEEQLHVAIAQLENVKTQSSVKIIQSLNEENKSLKEQVIKLRGEILRLQARFDDVQMSAAAAIDSLSQNSSEYIQSSPMSQFSSHENLNGQFHMKELQLHADHTSSDRLDNGNDEIKIELIPYQDSVDDVLPSIPAMNYDELDADAVVDLKMHNRIVEAKLNEMSAASLSPIVEDKLLHNIYNHYSLDLTNNLSLTRFSRFAKDFKLCAISAVPSESKVARQTNGPMLTNGDIDIIYMTVVKRLTTTGEEKDAAYAAEESKRLSSSFMSNKSFATENGKSSKAPLANQMSFHQFVIALKEIAARLYSDVIEKKTGTVLESLPQSQRDMAIRAAFEVMILKKVVNNAEKLGLVPWELMNLDQTLTLIHSSAIVVNCLIERVNQFCSWFTYYSTVLLLDKAHQGPGGRAVSPQKGAPDNMTESSFSHSQRRPRSNGGGIFKFDNKNSILQIRGMTYKTLSTFFNNFGIIPYLVKEQQLFELFSEILKWTGTKIDFLLSCLPNELIQYAPGIVQEREWGNQTRKQLIQRKVIGLGSFIVLFASVANMVFDDVHPEKRLQKLFAWTAQSGGSYLMQQNHLLRPSS